MRTIRIKNPKNSGLRKWTLLKRNCCADGLFSLVAKVKVIQRAYPDAEKQEITKPKRNADSRAKSKGLCIFMKSLNLWDLAFDKKK